MNNKKKLLVAGFLIFVFTLTALLIKSGTMKINSKIKANENVTFFVASDMHYLAKSLSDNGKAYNAFMESGVTTRPDYLKKYLASAYNNGIDNNKLNIPDSTNIK